MEVSTETTKQQKPRHRHRKPKAKITIEAENVPHEPELSDKTASELVRKPSKRHKRKNNKKKEDSTVEQESSTINCQVKERQAVQALTEPSRAVNEPRKRPPATQVINIGIEHIFPPPHLFTFESNAIDRKPTLITASECSRIATNSPNCSTLFPGLVNLPLGQVFPPTDDAKDQPKDHHVAEPTNQPTMNPPKSEKTREEILAEREAKKAAKLAAKNKGGKQSSTAAGNVAGPQAPQAQTKKAEKADSVAIGTQLSKSGTDASICEKLKDLHISDKGEGKPDAKDSAKEQPKIPTVAGKDIEKVAKPTSKAERRAVQEAQRAAKADALAKKQSVTVAPVAAAGPKEQRKVPVSGSVKPAGVKSVGAKQPCIGAKKSDTSKRHMMNLFNHLHRPKFDVVDIVNTSHQHPLVTKLGIQYAEGAIVGSKARCLALLKTLDQLINDYVTPPEKEFSRGFEEMLEPCMAFLQKCRPFSVSMTNALKYVKMHTRKLESGDSDSKQKSILLKAIETYIGDEIEIAEEAITRAVQPKICDGDVILTYGCSSLILHILEVAKQESKNFRVIIVDSRPRNNEHEMLRQLVSRGIDCANVMINAISFVLPAVTKVLLSAHALLANGSVMSRVGTAQIALMAKSYNVPVLVCCETHKFTERVQTDSFVYNELGNPQELVLTSGTRANCLSNPLTKWESIKPLTLLNLHYDVTPPELVTAVVTERAILPCTSVPVILRIRPSDGGY